jgi:anti-anti-sigma factor
VFGDQETSSPGWDGHLLLLHWSEPERRSGLAAWIRRGLENDEKVIFAEADAETPRRSVRSVLQDNGIDVVAATAEGRLCVLPLAEFYPPGGQAEIVEKALAEGYRAVRMSAEARAARAVLSERAYAAYERDMDRLCRRLPLSALCQYDREYAAGPRLVDIAEAHVDGIRERQLDIGGSNGELTLAGEVDLSNEDLLECALRAATNKAAATFWLDLSRVTFLGAGGCRALLVGTRHFRHQGGYVLLVACPPSIERMLRLLGFDRVTGLELVGADP